MNFSFVVGTAGPAMTQAPERCYDNLAFRKFASPGIACNDFLRHDFLLAQSCWQSCLVRCQRPLNRFLLPSGRLSRDRRPPRRPALAPTQQGVAVTKPARRFVPWRQEFRSIPGRPETGGRRRRRLAACAGGSLALSRLRPGHRQPRPRPAGVRAGVHGVRRPHGGDLAHAAGPGPHQGQRRGLCARREAIWRAAGSDRGVLGTGKRFRRQHGQPAHAAFAGVAGLRLPPLARCFRTRPSPH